MKQPSQLGKLIRTERMKRHWTRADLVYQCATKAGIAVSEMLIANLESGRTQYVRDPKVLRALRDVLGLTNEDIGRIVMEELP